MALDGTRQASVQPWAESMGRKPLGLPAGVLELRGATQTTRPVRVTLRALGRTQVLDCAC